MTCRGPRLCCLVRMTQAEEEARGPGACAEGTRCAALLGPGAAARSGLCVGRAAPAATVVQDSKTIREKHESDV